MIVASDLEFPLPSRQSPGGIAGVDRRLFHECGIGRTVVVQPRWTGAKSGTQSTSFCKLTAGGSMDQEAAQEPGGEETPRGERGQ